MSRRYLSVIIFILIGLAIAVGITALFGFDEYEDEYENSAPKETINTPVTMVTGKTYTFSEVAKHNTAQNCWTTVNASVYDVTSWISQHPGGQQAIIGLCGIDGSEAFNGQHGGERRPANELASFKIGDLAK